MLSLRPLSANDLTQIRVRYDVASPCALCHQGKVVREDTVTLVHEIRYLCARALKAHRLRNSHRRPNNCLHGVWKEFQETLIREPCVVELGVMKSYLLGSARCRARAMGI